MQLSDFGVTRNQKTLPNGTRIITFERPQSPISIRVGFFSGSRFDPAGKEGLAHFAEHMIMSGNETYPTKTDIGSFIESRGAYFNAYTGADTMTVVLDFADKSDLVDIWDLLQQLLQYSIFDQQTIDNERGAIIAELQGKASNPGTYVHYLWRNLAYQGNDLSRFTIGSEETVRSITREDLLNYYQSMLISNRMVVVASGDITVSEVEELMSAQPLAQPANEQMVLPDSHSTRDNPIEVERYPGSKQVAFSFGFPSVSFSSPDYWSLFLLARIVGASRVSRLYQKLRNERGLVYWVNAQANYFYDLGRFRVVGDCKREDIQTVLDIITEELKLVAQNGISEVELQTMKLKTQKSQKLNMQTSADWANYHANNATIYPDITTTVVDNLAAIQNLDVATINEAAQKYLSTDSWYLALCGDIATDDIEVKF